MGDDHPRHCADGLGPHTEALRGVVRVEDIRINQIVMKIKTTQREPSRSWTRLSTDVDGEPMGEREVLVVNDNPVNRRDAPPVVTQLGVSWLTLRDF
jgi:hypothetical protein